MTSRPVLNPYLILGVGILFISFSAILVRSSTAPPMVIAAYRLLLTACLLSPVWWLKHRREVLSLNRRDWALAFLSGIFLALHFALWFSSLFYTSVASSTVLVTLQPVFAFVGAYFLFGEKTRPAALVGAATAVVGGMVLGWGDLALGGTALLGDIMALGGAAMVTGYWLTGQHLRKNLSLITYTYIVYTTAGLLLAAASLLAGYAPFSYPVREWLIFLLLAVFPTLLGHSLLNWVIRWVPATTVSVSILGEPVGAALLAYWIFHEQPGPFQWTGGILIVLGVYFFLRTKEAPETIQTTPPPRRQEVKDH
ncbi:DMT family transporter [Paludifilum halophilum]|uniref:EamA domain-containing protein n=1 Tax=Paludifilum halophilum TaxID=1642702 RepID=A0A235B7V3_9BACL|nr:DMT family transporter [Paludifilum halophilum]OYD08384.1 hypothetical protein CHM34_05985 [Paludifilum halophilum]